MYRFGDIVEAAITDPNGENRKPRPVIIITPTEDIEPEGTVVVVAISGSLIPAILLDGWFELPFHPDGRCQTKLRKRSVAKCTWRRVIDCSEIISKRGTAPGNVLQAIAKYMANLTGK